MSQYLLPFIQSKNILPGFIVLCSFSMTACMQGKSTQDNFSSFVVSNADISENTLKLVNSAFTQSFLGGDWRYKGASRKNGAINAYIQIPRDLDMSVAAQKNYLKQAICPSVQHQQMWSEIQSIPLYVHVYTHTKKRSVFSGCANPIV